MRAMTRLPLIAALPLLAAGCTSSPTVENVTISNDITVNTVAPADDGMINYADPAEAGNAGGTP